MALSKNRPNVLVFMLDTQRADNVSCYGYDKPTTPNIDRLAAEGAVFLNNISPATWTLPSVASMMTGLHVHSHGASASYEGFCDRPTTIAETLAPLGYRTIGLFANIYAVMSRKGFRETHMFEGGQGGLGPNCFALSRKRMEIAMRWLEYNSVKDRVPFFMYIQIMDPHMPLTPVSPFRERFALKDATEDEIKAIPLNPNSIHLGQARLTERQYAIAKSLYDAETAGADSHAGVLMDYMRKANILDDTVVIIMGDHGECYGEHKKMDGTDHFAHHLCLYEELIRVPLVIRFPEAFPTGKRVENLTQTHDIFPTLAELVRFEAPQCQGFSLLSALGDKPARTFTLTEYQKSVHMAGRLVDRAPDYDPRLHMRWLKAWRKDGLKYIWASDLRDELYDLRKDPGERHNLIQQMPEKATEMRLEMEKYLAALPHANVGDYILPGKCGESGLNRLRGMEWFHDQR